jgi:hypothetical protein
MLLLALALALAPSAAEPAAQGDEDDRVPLTVRGAYGEGLRAETADGSFAVGARARLQVRSVTAADLSGQAASAGDALSQDFLIRRARVVINGHVLDGMVSWNLQLGLSPFDVEEDLPIVVRDAYITVKAPAGLQLRTGQMKVPFNRQRINSSSALQFPERTRVNNELNLDRDIGVRLAHESIGSEHKVLAAWIAVFGGDGRNRPRPSSGLLYAGRLQVAPFGGFDDDTEEADLSRSSKLRVATSVAAAFNDRTVRTRSTLGDELAFDDAISYAHGAADVLFKWYGFSFKSEVLLRGATQDLGDDGDARSAVGAFVQTGYMITEHVEVAGRLARLAPLDASTWGGPPNDPDLVGEVETGLGASLYVLEHDLKVQAEANFVRHDDAPDAAWFSTGALVVQMQFYF